MHIKWKVCKSYDSAKYLCGVYCHERDGKALYWGIANKGFESRYNTGYSHWIEGSLRGGAILYVGELSDVGEFTMLDAEAYLIREIGSEFNIQKPNTSLSELHHSGCVPKCISSKFS
jgi:hypothetical protein